MSLVYRKEIDGLRAIAVVPVILFHTKIPWFSGGYVGVDIFFVISGFLITSIILDECDAGTFTIGGFYERRVRRILPALFFVMFCTIPFAWLWMPPIQLSEYAKSLVATTFFSSNFLFWKEIGYFMTDAAEKPLLHTWSLAIEEQYYLFYPVFLSMFWFVGKGRLAIGIGLVALASFGVSMWGFPNDSDANFYLMPSRAWELLAGSLLAFAEQDRPLHTRIGTPALQLLSCGGLLMIAVAIFGFGERTPSSGLFLLLPIVGTWILLAFAVPGTIANHFLSQRLLVFVGLMSFSAYLWHQPLFAFARLRDANAPSTLFFGAIFTMVGVLAYLTWQYIELPFRNRQRFSQREIVAFAATAALSLSAIGLLGSLTKIGNLRFTEQEQAAVDPAASTDSDCKWLTPLPQFPKIQTCHFGALSGSAPIILWGDSHADALIAAANEAFQENGKVGLRVRNRYCRPLVGTYDSREFSRENTDVCAKSQAAVISFLQVVKPEAVIIAMRWTFQLYPIEGKIGELAFDNGEGGREQESDRSYVVLNSSGQLTIDADEKANTVRKFIRGFAAIGAPILIQYPVPEVGWNIPDLNFRGLISTGVVPQEITTSFQRYIERNAFIIGVLDSIIQEPNNRALKVGRLFCNSYIADRCAAQVNGIPYYFDDDHLSKAGAMLVVAEILDNLR